VERLKINELFELGIHPNFFPGSIHGNTEKDVLRHCLEIIPNAQVVRTHGLYQSTSLITSFCSIPNLQVDLSLFMPSYPINEPLYVNYNGGSLLRLPFVWEDDYHLQHASTWSFENVLETDGKYIVFDFHPIHIALNSRSMNNYQKMKQRVPSLQTMDRTAAEPYINVEFGTGDFFKGLVQKMGKMESKTIIEMLHCGGLL
jgi:hypothetical protein